MGQFTDQLGLSAAGMAMSGGLGLLLGEYNDARQLRQQQELQRMQITGAKELTDYNQEKQYQMWLKTNYAAQVAEMKKAGLNPALLYGKQGGGGITGNAGGAMPTGGNAPTGGHEIQDIMGMGMQLELMKAQKENIEADTRNKEATTPKIGAETDSIKQGIENQKAQEALTRVNTRIAQLDEVLKGETLQNSIAMADWNERQALEILDKMVRENKIGKATENDQIDKIKADLAGQLLMNEIHRITPAKYRSEIAVNLQSLTNMAHQIVQEWRKIEISGSQVTDEQRRKWSETLHNETKLDLDVVNNIIDGFILKSILNPKTSHKPVTGFK